MSLNYDYRELGKGYRSVIPAMQALEISILISLKS